VKKIKAFFCAFFLFVLTAAGIFLFAEAGVKINHHEFCTWTNSTKFNSTEAIRKNLSSNTLVTFGSSEFEHGKKTQYHPKQVFQNTKFQPMLIGAGNYQSLTHAITLASIGNDIPNKKVVLFVSPTWFSKNGVKAEAFASNFSEENYVGMLKNTKISDATKSYIINRTHQLMKVDETTLSRLQIDEKVINNKEHVSLTNYLQYYFYQEFLKEKTNLAVATQYHVYKKKENMMKEKKPFSSKGIHWDHYNSDLKRDCEAVNADHFYMNRVGYHHMKVRLKAEKDSKSKAKNLYSKSVEYQDLECFLTICKELNIQPMIISLPVNGYWYDYMGAKASTRKKYYKNIRQIAKEYDADIVDLSGQEFTPNFFEDGLHLAGKGWITVNEILYNYGTENKKQ